MPCRSGHCGLPVHHRNQAPGQAQNQHPNSPGDRGRRGENGSLSIGSYQGPAQGASHLGVDNRVAESVTVSSIPACRPSAVESKLTMTCWSCHLVRPSACGSTEGQAFVKIGDASVHMCTSHKCLQGLSSGLFKRATAMQIVILSFLSQLLLHQVLCKLWNSDHEIHFCWL